MTTAELVRLGMPVAERLAHAWGLSLGAVYPAATNCLVLAAGDDRVLRVPLVDEEARSGYHAMLAFSGQGGIRVLRQDPESRSTLMARAIPGTMLADARLSVREEVRAACEVIRRLPSTLVPEQMDLADWYEPFLKVRRADGIPDELLRHAQTLAGRLLSTLTRRRLMHGDLHHFNLLRDQENWVAIDPKGVAAEIEFEPAAFLRNPFTTLHQERDLVSIMRERIDTFAELLGVSAERIRRWGIAQNVLSAWWDEPSARGRTIRAVEAIRASAQAGD